MDKFAFIVHPANKNQVIANWKTAKFLPLKLVEKIIERRQPFKISNVTNLKSLSGKEAQGYFIALPLLPHQILKLNSNFVIDKIVVAGKIAEDLGAKLVGLGAYTSVVGDKGVTIAKALDIAVTTGNSYTVTAVIQGILKASRIMNIKLEEAKITVIGATGSIGKACVRVLAQKKGSYFILNARDQKKISDFASTIKKDYSCSVKVEENYKKAVAEADIIITTSSSPSVLIDINDLKSGSIACDVSVPKNISLKSGLRKDVLIFEGGIVKLPSKVDFGIDVGLPPGFTHACVAETMILTLAEKFEDFSIGDNLELSKIEEMNNLALEYGFSIADF